MYRYVCLAAAVMCVTAAVHAQDQNSNVIVVRGEAVSRVPADTVIWELKMRREAADRTEARTALEAETARLYDTATAAGLKPSDVALSPVRIKSNEQHSSARKAARFEATRTLTMTQRDLSAALAFCKRLAAANPDELTYRLEHSRRSLLEHETQLQAVENAKRQASSLAETLAVQLGAPIAVANELGASGAFGLEPHFSTYHVTPIEHVHDATAFTGTPIEIRASVYVTYAIGSRSPVRAGA